MHYGNPGRRQERERGRKSVKEINENFANLGREVGIQIHGFPNRLNPKRATPSLRCNPHGKHQRKTCSRFTKGYDR